MTNIEYVKISIFYLKVLRLPVIWFAPTLNLFILFERKSMFSVTCVMLLSIMLILPTIISSLVADK